MKLHLPLSLRASLLTTLCLGTAGLAEGDDTTLPQPPSTDTMGANWKNTAYIGDSITHGYSNGSRSYRWQLFKILVDNGISQNEVGIRTGYNSGASNIKYGGATFDNLHSSQSGIWGAQIAGEKADTKYLNGSNLADWLGVDDTYKGSYTMKDSSDAAATPDTAFVMMGTNDVLHNTYAANHGMTAGYVTATETVPSNIDNLINDATRQLTTVVETLREANSDMNIIVTTLPAWSDDLPERTLKSNGIAKNDEPELLAQYNAALTEWAKEQKVTLVDVNKGMIDVAKLNADGETSGYALDNMYMAGDGVHPSAQGDLIIAGNIAQQLGYAGRTAGQKRKGAETFAHQAADIVAASTHSGVTLVGSEGSGLSLAADATLSYNWAEGSDLSSGFTVDFSFDGGLGDGATGGWNTTQHFALSVGDGSHSGTLYVNEAYIQWGDTILYSMDMSQLTDDLRVAYVYGNNSAEIGLSGGFYVWLGDMLIGEALSSLGKDNNISLSNGTGSSLTLGHLSLTEGSYAPNTTGVKNDDNSFLAPEQTDATAVTLTGKTFGNGTNATIRSLSAVSGGNANITVEGTNSLSSKWLVVNNGANNSTYEGNLSVTLTGNVTHNSSGNYYNVLHYQGTLKGDISLTVADGFTETNGKAWGTFLGASADSGTAKVEGDVSLVFSSKDLTVTRNTNAALFNSNCVIAGIGKNANVTGAVNITVNEGTFNGDVYGGVYSTAGSISGGTHVTLNGGTISGNVYGGGRIGTITNGTAVTVGGGATVTGDLISAGGADNSTGTISGGTQLTLKGVEEGSAFATSFKGTLSGGKSGVTGERALVLDGVTADLNKATLRDFDAVNVTGKSNTSLSSLGGASKLNVDSGNRLVLTGGDNDATVNGGGTVELRQGAALRLNEAGADANTSVSYELTGGALTVGNHGSLGGSILIHSGSLTKENAATTLGRLDIVADGAVTLSNITAAEISRLETTDADAVISGLSGTLTLEEVVVTMGVDDAIEDGAAFLFSYGGLDVGTLTLHLDAELSAALVEQVSGGAVGYTAAGNMPGLVVNSGELSAERVIINLAEGYGDYVATFNGFSSENGYSYVNYSLSRGAVPEPATATLSLLALAALAARRRRRG